MSTGIGERLRRLRHERRLSQEDVARRTGIGLKSYGDLERGKTTDPHFSTLSAIAGALETTVADLAGEGTGKVSAPPDTGPRKYEGSPYSLPAAEVLLNQAELWADQLFRGFYDETTLEKMYILAGVLAINHVSNVGKIRDSLPSNLRDQLEAAEERFALVDSQIWETLEKTKYGAVVAPPDELATRREAEYEDCLQQLRSAA
jgi:transcriptional regulator with XRE-family HTH domain